MFLEYLNKFKDMESGAAADLIKNLSEWAPEFEESFNRDFLDEKLHPISFFGEWRKIVEGGAWDKACPAGETVIVRKPFV